MLTSRMIEILKAIVDEFVATAEPVGSKTLVEKYGLTYSSATIRNDMAALENMGYLEKPHTSAGRVPSNKGYQYYCEHLLKKDFDEEVKYALTNIFDKKQMNVEEAIKESCKVISDMTSLATGMLGPNNSNQILEHIKMFPIDSKTAVCVLITDSGHTESKTFNFKEDVSLDDITNTVNILNDRLKGTRVSDLMNKLESIRPILTNTVKRHEMIFNAFAGAFMKFANETLYFSGASNMMYQPEYADIEKLRDIVRYFDDTNLFRQITNHDKDETYAITNKGTEMVWKDDLAIISSNIHVSSTEEAKLMVVGPRRMEYSKVVSLLDFIAKEIEDMYK